MSQKERQQASKRIIPAIIACSIAISHGTAAFAGPGDVNSVNTGSKPVAGTYYNTTGKQTTFINDKGIVFQNGTYRFLNTNRVDGGNAYIQAPYVGMNRATLDASGARNGAGQFIGNGGNIRVNARMFYATDSDIVVAGKSGGSAVFSVGSFFARNTKIDARGTDGVGGQVRIDASNIVDIDKNTLFDASGRVVGSFDNSLIDIKGAVVNMDGVLKANGMGSQGGHINLTAAGNPDECIDCDGRAANKNGFLSNAQLQDVRVTFNKLKSQGGSVIIGGAAHADGASGVSVTRDTGYEYNYDRAGHGGTITVNAQNNIINKGKLSAKGGEGQKQGVMLNGGHGGTVALLAGKDGTVTNAGEINVNGGNGVNSQFSLNDGYGTTLNFQAGGYGGNGGVIVTNGKQTVNSGQMLAKGGNAGNGAAAYAKVEDYQISIGGNAQAYAQGARGSNGGNGGLIVLNNSVNPTNTGVMDVRGGNGGNGGDATAIANATSISQNPAHITVAKADAIAGDAGQGGYGGTIVMKSPTTFTNGGSVFLNGGTSGIAGKGTATANAVGVYNTNATAYAKGNSQTGAAYYSNSANPTGSANVAYFAPKANGAMGKLDTLRPTEAVVHNGSTIILNNTSAGANTLTGLVSLANVRTTSQQAGGGIIPVGNKNLVVGDISGQALTINPGAISTTFNGVNKVTINTGGDLTNADTFVTRDVSAIAKGNVTNVGNIITGESALVAAGGNFNNAGNITSSNNLQGGSVILHSNGKLTNSGQISAGALNYGGVVDIHADVVENQASGRIASNSWSQYGNGGSAAPNQNAGMVNITARRISNSGQITADQVDGTGKGGIVWMFAKENFTNNANAKVSANGQKGGLVVVGVKSDLPGQLINNGTIQANQGGKVVLADGKDQVNQIICLDPPPPPPPPVTPPPPPPGTPPTAPPVDTGVLIPSTGPVDTTAVVGVPPVVEVADANLFLARGFEGMTKGILDQAYVTYQSALERGNDVTNANQKAIEYLMQAGMTCCVAEELAQRIDTGKMSLNTPDENGKIRDLLNVIAGTCLPEDAGQILVQ